MFRGFGKYRLVYAHLWQTYGQSWPVRWSFVTRVVTRACKLIALPVALSQIITSLSAQNYNGAYRAVFVFVGFSLVVGILTPLTKYIGMLGENKVYASSTTNYFSRLVHTDLDYFNSNLSGYLTAATRQYTDSCVQLVRALRERYMDTVLGMLFPLLVIFWLDMWLALVALGLSLVQAYYLFWASHAITSLRTRSRELFKYNSGRIADVIANILAVRSTAQEEAHVKQIGEGAVIEARAFHVRYTKQAKLNAIREFITVAFFMVLLWLTVNRMSGGHIDIGAAVLVVTYTATILTAIYTLSDNLDEHDDLVDKVIPAFDILDRQNAIIDPVKPKKLPKVTGDIQLVNISFSYDTGQPVFQNFSLHIPAGQKVGIVGMSGAGKSTLTKLLLRFNDVEEGHILLDGIDIRDVRQVDLRRQIAYVPQEPLLLHTSIKDNVLLARPNATGKEVQRALRTAHASHFIARLPEGVNSIVGERGVKLSGGQKQRVAIARAVLRKAPIMILDEATSALDSESEQIIKDSFKDVLKGKTAIVIAHRLSTLSEMDRIIVVDKGRCIEDGTHDELLAVQGAYAGLWNRQLKNVED